MEKIKNEITDYLNNSLAGTSREEANGSSNLKSRGSQKLSESRKESWDSKLFYKLLPNPLE